MIFQPFPLVNKFTFIYLFSFVISQYLEKRPDGSSIVRSQRAEDRAARVHERDRQRHLDQLVGKLQQEFEKRQTGTRL